MHTPDCNDPLEWWPEGAPTDVSVGALPLTPAITNPVRVVGSGPWLAFWGNFGGLRIGFAGNGQQFPAINGAVMPVPLMDGKQIDLYLARESGGLGTATIARFKTREAAEAWGGRPTPNSGGAGASEPNRSTPARATVAAGVISHTWTQAGFIRATMSAPASNVGTISIGNFRMPPGSSISGFVGQTATGFSATGTNGDDLDILEFGRV